MKTDTFIRIDEETKKELLLLTILQNKKSMAKMIKDLIEFYKSDIYSKEEINVPANQK